MYEKYFNDYNNFTLKHNFGLKHLTIKQQCIYKNSTCSLVKYSYKRQKSKKSNPFFIIPSIFHTPEILFLNKKSYFINELQSISDVYLIHWHEILDSTHTLDDYVLYAIKCLDVIYLLEKQKINLIGHCIGGNIAIATTNLKQSYVNTIMLMTTAWCFEHFSYYFKIHQNMNLDNIVKNLPFIPKVYIQILFFLMSPENFYSKYQKYLNTQSIKDKILLFQIENWLSSAYNLPSATYFQIMKDLLHDNNLIKLKWKINNIIINPSNIHIPSFLISAKNDKIAPINSISPLCQALKNHHIINVDGGHISYLIGIKLNTYIKEYQNWLANS